MSEDNSFGVTTFLLYSPVLKIQRTCSSAQRHNLCRCLDATVVHRACPEHARGYNIFNAQLGLVENVFCP